MVEQARRVTVGPSTIIASEEVGSQKEPNARSKNLAVLFAVPLKMLETGMPRLDKAQIVPVIVGTYKDEKGEEKNLTSGHLTEIGVEDGITKMTERGYLIEEAKKLGITSREYEKKIIDDYISFLPELENVSDDNLTIVDRRVPLKLLKEKADVEFVLMENDWNMLEKQCEDSETEKSYILKTKVESFRKNESIVDRLGDLNSLAALEMSIDPAEVVFYLNAHPEVTNNHVYFVNKGKLYSIVRCNFFGSSAASRPSIFLADPNVEPTRPRLADDRLLRRETGV
jgi:hypothetical protein